MTLVSFWWHLLCFSNSNQMASTTTTTQSIMISIKHNRHFDHLIHLTCSLWWYYKVWCNQYYVLQSQPVLWSSYITCFTIKRKNWKGINKWMMSDSIIAIVSLCMMSFTFRKWERIHKIWFNCISSNNCCSVPYCFI